MGIEPTSEAWEAPILPLNYARGKLAEREGFEPPIPVGMHDFESCAFNQALPSLQEMFRYDSISSALKSSHPSLRCAEMSSSVFLHYYRFYV